MLCHRTLSYPVVSIEVKLLTVRSITQETQRLSLLVLLLLLFYVRLSKNSFFILPGVSLKADAKVRLFSELTKLFQKNFAKK